ncbi:tRNA lysidine(34) synthetase [Desulfogranum mediterraneum]|uniref:tRNA lysidine(34) synthetase n=1 Tax=Desulfogranum mediterraneum TaxID=160661 RepID=UPI001E439390|nr:ATP-binding protein [Desulfogranum mediterraneum]
MAETTGASLGMKAELRRLNRRVGRAMHDYGMLADGDRVLVAVSGGMDSLILAWLLDSWHNKAPISYQLTAVHVDMEGDADQPGPAALQVRAAMERLGLNPVVLPAAWRPSPEQLASGARKDVCFQCARSRRSQLFAHARDHGFSKLALGHHRDDIIETFFLNLTSAGNLSTMSPCQALFSGRLSIIRPLAYCDKEDVDQLGRRLGFSPIRSACPLSEQTRREEIHQLVQTIYASVPDAKEHIFAALGNVRQEYLLSPNTTKRT